MTVFAYTARGSDGPVSGLIDAASAASAADQIAARGVIPLTVVARAADKPAAGPGNPLQADRLRQWLRRPVPIAERMLFARQMHVMLRSGVPIMRALQSLIDSTTHPDMRRGLASIRQGLESGTELSATMNQHPALFDAFYVSMVKVGEVTGHLEAVFLRLASHLAFDNQMRQQVKSAMRYPMFVMIAMSIAIVVINLMVIPAFATVFANMNAQLPLMTRILLASSRFTIDYGGWLAGALAVAVALFRRWKVTPAGRLAWDRFTLKLPIAGPILRKAALARFSRSLALSLGSGVPVVQALSVVAATVENAYIGQRIDMIREQVERGESILRAAALAQVFTPVALQMIAVGEETGAVDEMLDEVADAFSSEVEYELKNLSQSIEPILILSLGVLVLILALGVFLPIWDLGRVALKR